RPVWPTEGVQLLRAAKAAASREKGGEMHTALLSLSRCLLVHYGASMGHASRLFADVGHVPTRVLMTDTSIHELNNMKPASTVKATDKLAAGLLKWAESVRSGEEREEDDQLQMLAEWSKELLTSSAAHGLNTVVLTTLVSMGREQREALLPCVWSDEQAAGTLIMHCLEVLLASSPPDETFERNSEEHSTTVVCAPAAGVDAALAHAVCLFLLNCTPYLAMKISPADLATWDRLQAMHERCAALVVGRTKPDAIQSLFAALPECIESFAPAMAAFKPEELQPEPVEEEEKVEKAEEEKKEDKDKADKKKKNKDKKAAVDKEAKKRKRAERVVDPASTAALLRLTRVARLAAAALSERAAVAPEHASAALATAAACLASAAPSAVRPAAEAAAAAVYELATRCLEVYGEGAAQSGMLSIALAAAATRQPPSTDYERSRAELLQYARLLAAAARCSKQGLLKDQVRYGSHYGFLDQVSLYSQLLGRLLQAAAAHGERLQRGGADSSASCKRRRRDEQRTLHAAVKAANAVNEESHFSKVLPFVIADCLLPLRAAPPAVQYPAVLLSHGVDRFGRASLATCLPPAERLAYTRMFPTFKEMNRRVV
ncbi:hypothetical protein PFISCL1PPCAC_22811, partial [Pristionchus fissidentatus]